MGAAVQAMGVVAGSLILLEVNACAGCAVSPFFSLTAIAPNNPAQVGAMLTTAPLALCLPGPAASDRGPFGPAYSFEGQAA